MQSHLGSVYITSITFNVRWKMKINLDSCNKSLPYCDHSNKRHWQLRVIHAWVSPVQLNFPSFQTAQPTIFPNGENHLPPFSPHESWGGRGNQAIWGEPPRAPLGDRREKGGPSQAPAAFPMGDQQSHHRQRCLLPRSPGTEPGPSSCPCAKVLGAQYCRRSTLRPAGAGHHYRRGHRHQAQLVLQEVAPGRELHHPFQLGGWVREPSESPGGNACGNVLGLEVCGLQVLRPGWSENWLARDSVCSGVERKWIELSDGGGSGWKAS